MKTKRLLAFIPVFLILIAALTACNLPAGDVTPTAGNNATQAHETAVARVTEISLLTSSPAAGEPSATPTEAGTPTATPAAGTPSATPAPATARPTASPIPCDIAEAGNPIDVTIPDDTKIVAGAVFTKTWRLVNAGTCTWNSSYAVVYDSGAKLGIKDSVNLPGSVPPGGTVDISVPMIAPTTPGFYQSNWKLRNTSGVLFGIGGNAAFWVRIEVVSPTATPTATATATVIPPTFTPTPVVYTNGSVNLVIGNVVNLDNLFVVGGSGNDISYVTDVNDNHVLTPQGIAVFGVYGASQPTLNACKTASLGGAVMTVEANPVGTYICYRTDENRYGWMQIAAFNAGDGALTLNVLTWAGGQ